MQTCSLPTKMHLLHTHTHTHTNRIGFFVSRHINHQGLFNAKAILIEKLYYLNVNVLFNLQLEDKGVHTFPKGISPKVNKTGVGEKKRQGNVYMLTKKKKKKKKNFFTVYTYTQTNKTD